MNKSFNIKQKSGGFTLTEIMIAVSIIAILATVGFSSFNQAQIRGRDAKRKQDLRSIAIALDLYKIKNGTYPNSDGVWRLSTAAQPWIPALTSDYIDKLPTDPLTGSAYLYYATPATCGSYAAGKFFALTVNLENANDPDTLLAKDQKWCDTQWLKAQHLWSPNAFVIVTQ